MCATQHAQRSKFSAFEAGLHWAFLAFKSTCSCGNPMTRFKIGVLLQFGKTAVRMTQLSQLSVLFFQVGSLSLTSPHTLLNLKFESAVIGECLL